MVDITNKQDISKRLSVLNMNTVPVFGKMTPQHMVEHLAFSVRYSNGKSSQKLLITEEKAQLFKSVVIYSEKELTPGFKSPLLGDDLPELQFPDLSSAATHLLSELDDFNRYFLENKDAKPVSPVLGELTYEEWISFHNKHFTHHFKQFNLA